LDTCICVCGVCGVRLLACMDEGGRVAKGRGRCRLRQMRVQGAFGEGRRLGIATQPAGRRLLWQEELCEAEGWGA
jgi:hypothetical protein